MKRLALSAISAIAVAAGAAGIAAPSASALVNYCTGPGTSGCNTAFDGYRSYIESRSSKTGGIASYICTTLVHSTGGVAGNCAYDATFVRVCYGNGLLVYGVHSGSSNAWTVEGRDATASDALVCT